jgi:hypothetical protein
MSCGCASVDLLCSGRLSTVCIEGAPCLGASVRGAHDKRLDQFGPGFGFVLELVDWCRVEASGLVLLTDHRSNATEMVAI